ncbi:hypothetical protein CAL29_17695 [Bordetella genomosp. 10]|uniref:Uncharacterized protein n=1 Tax=Bordetella genomosp. 10 TaxID=1416804 RepID=A0A261RYU0_9BORD|nr:hypothetical protein [Bordetella genomosp. 10]OZI29927.1 hypothetical protein CAL29_17695 [Bordetella genomosp. 10]
MHIPSPTIDMSNTLLQHPDANPAPDTANRQRRTSLPFSADVGAKSRSHTAPVAIRQETPKITLTEEGTARATLAAQDAAAPIAVGETTLPDTGPDTVPQAKGDALPGSTGKFDRPRTLSFSRTPPFVRLNSAVETRPNAAKSGDVPAGAKPPATGTLSAIAEDASTQEEAWTTVSLKGEASSDAAAKASATEIPPDHASDATLGGHEEAEPAVAGEPSADENGKRKKSKTGCFRACIKPRTDD